MAEHKANPLQLHWLRQPTGEFVIQMIATFPDNNGQLRALAIRSWSLTTEEEESLKQTLAGKLAIALHLPGNGHHKE